ncbi:MAG: hypothetical protein PHW92_14825, partial [Lutibacter sp.]|nr:hypothetical protein [Lutibacter sp.]
SFPVEIICAALNFTKLDEEALGMLKTSSFPNQINLVEKFKRKLAINVKQLTIIQKCNAVMIIFTHTENVSEEYLHHCVLDAWHKLSNHGIIEFINKIKFFHNEMAIRFIAEAALGLYSVTVGDSQVFSQINNAIKAEVRLSKNEPLFSILSGWLQELIEEVKEKTILFSGNTSIERIAVNQLVGMVATNSNILVVGAGQSGSLIAKILTEEYNYKVWVTNRNQEKLDEIMRKNTKINIVRINDWSVLKNIQAIFWALDNNSETSDLFAKLENYFGKTTPFVFDLATPAMKKKLAWTVFDVQFFSKEAHKTRNERAGAVNQVRQILNKNIITFLNKMKISLGKISTDIQTTCASSRLSADMLDIIKQRSFVFNSIRNNLLEKGFYEINTPYIVGVSTDPPRVDKGGMIEVIWPRGERAFLRQSNQLYKQMVIASGMDKIFEIGPFWRAETENSFRHLQETIGLDVEISNPKNLNTIIDLAYSIICDSYYQMKEMSLPLAELNLPKNKPPIISYKEAVDLLNSNGFSCSYGSDLGVIGEAKLGEVIKKKKDSDIFVISHYPSNIKKFYTKQGTSFLTETFDIILCGWELVSGAIRENNRKKIEYSMKLANINVADYAFYLSIVDNSVGHGGFGLGLDRLIAKFLDIAVIDNCVPFPRTFEKLIP